VLAGLILLSVVLAALGVVHARRWAARRASWWRAGLRSVVCLLPGLVLVLLPELMSVVFAGREGTFGQILYVWPGVVSWLSAATLGALVVLAARARAVVSGTRGRNREESDGTRGVAGWESVNRPSAS
jgi:hypothetical protein